MAQSFETSPVFVSLSNIPPSASKTDIQRLLDRQAATFKMGELSRDETSLQSVEVELCNDRDVRNVLSLNGKIFLGYEILVDKFLPEENPVEVFVRKISVFATTAEISQLFSRFGKIEEVTLPRWHDSGKPRGFGFIRFSSEEEAQRAINWDGKLKLHGIRLSIRANRRVKKPGKPQPPKESNSKRMPERPSGCTTIYVGNIDFDASEQEISALFTTCGQVRSVRIVRQQFTNRSRGFAYIEFEDEEGVTEAMRMDGKDFHGRNIRVDFAEPYDPSRGKVRNFTSFSPDNPGSETDGASGSLTGSFLPSPSGFILNHFIDKPLAGMAALAGCMQSRANTLAQHQQSRTQQVQQPRMFPMQNNRMAAPSPPFVSPFLPNCSVPFASLSAPRPAVPVAHIPHMAQIPNFFNPSATQTVYNVNSAGNPVQIEATFYTQGIPGVGQFIAPYAMVTQRRLPQAGSSTSNPSSQTMQAEPPARAPAPSVQPQTAVVPSTGQPLASTVKRCFSEEEERCLRRGTAPQMFSTLGRSVRDPASPYMICSDGMDVEPWESREVDNAVLY